MKVLIAALENTLDSPVSKRFGHAPYYLIVDLETMQVNVIDNRNTGDEHDHAIIPQAAKAGVKAFITGNIGPQAYKLVESLNLQVALARKMSGKEALEKLQRGELKILDAPTLKHSIHDHKHHFGYRRGN